MWLQERQKLSTFQHAQQLGVFSQNFSSQPKKTGGATGEEAVSSIESTRVLSPPVLATAAVATVTSNVFANAAPTVALAVGSAPAQHLFVDAGIGG